jgi:hypothetical protein
MKHLLPTLLIVGFLASNSHSLATAQTHEHTADPETSVTVEGEDDEPIQRVARLNFVDGDVSFLRAGVTEWAPAVQNLPLLSGDQIYVGDGARAEIQLGNGNYVRLTERTSMTIADLTHTVAQLEVTEGIALIRLERFGSAFTRFEIDTPNAALVLEQDGFYRVNVRGDEESEVVVQRGSAEVATIDGNFKVKEGHRLLVDTSTDGRLEVAVDNSRDEWDVWSQDRDQTLDHTIAAASPDYVTNHERDFHCFFGASELAGYGSWTNVASYGYCWVPRVASGWAPYRAGQWLWSPRIGWTWLSHEPWGWAPYHYGRWAFLPNLGWSWVPGIHAGRHNYRHSYYQWRPGLVHFFNYRTPQGQFVGWYPLWPGERWRRFDRHNDRDDRDRRNASRRNGSGWPGFNGRPNRNQSVSVLPVAGFSRPDQTPARPGTITGDPSRWAGRDARPGLPELSPTNSAAVPRWHANNGQGRQRTVVIPPSEVARRPVVTRNRPSGSEAENSAPRERRLISFRPVNDVNGTNRWRNRTEAPAGTNDSERKSRIVPSPQDSIPIHGNDSQPRRRQRDKAEEEGQSNNGRIGSGGRENRPENVESPATPAEETRRKLKLEREHQRIDDTEPNEDQKGENGRSRIRLNQPNGSQESTSNRPKDSDGEAQPRSKRPKDNEQSNQSVNGGGFNSNSSSQRNINQTPSANSETQRREQPRPEVREERRQERQEQKQERREERQQQKQEPREQGGKKGKG